jgi:hypothetical protein
LDLVEMKSRGGGRTSLLFEVEFLVPEPDTRTCHLVVHLDDGTTRRFDDFTLTTGPGRRERFTVPIPGGDIVEAAAPCRTYTLETSSSGN